ncbi:MAG: tetratricopeptide repeat protein [Gammaproteobacteria bacterium]|jgi:tetratricopeptide (TPR) repeat protein|nr:tetratricopeptide repeat protein [Gammaproteobacteria bacterium]
MMILKLITERGLSWRGLTVVLSVCAVLTGCESPEERALAYVTEAQKLLEADNLVKAELEAKNALQIQPKNAEARMVLARVAESRGDFSEMAGHLRSAIEASPDSLEPRLKLGTLYALSSMFDEANAELKAAARLAPDAAGVHVLRARVLAAQGDLEGAAVELQAALAQDPNDIEAVGLFANVTAATDVNAAIAMVDRAMQAQADPRALRLLKIQLLQRAGDVDAVDAAYKALLADYPDEADYVYQYARFLAAAGQPAAVESVLKDLTARQPENIAARLALVQFVAGNRGSAAGEELLQGFLAEQPDAHQLRLLLARVYQLSDRQEAAITAYEQVIERAGNDDAALTAKSRLAAIKLSTGDLEAGEALIDEVLEVDSVNTDALILRGALNYDRDELKDAVSDLRSVLREDPDNQRAQLLLARTHAKAEDYLLAKDAYRRAIGMQPADAQSTLELVRLLVRESELDEAEALLTEQIRATPADLRVTRALVAILLERERFDDALAEARRFGAIEGQEAVGDYLRGGIYQARGQDEAALEAFAASLARKPTAREPLQGYIASLIRLDRAAEARAYLERLGREYPDNLYSRTLLGQVLAGSGDTVAAREVFESTLSANEEYLPAYTALAGLNSTDLGAQIEVYKRGTEAVPDSQELVLLLGTAYERNGQYDDAIAAYEQALESNPGMQAVANNLAALIADFRRDRASLQQALELVSDFADSDNPAFVDTVGWLHHQLGDYDAAQPLLERAVAAAGQVAVLRFHLGMNYYALGKPQRAREHLELATAEGSPDYPGKAEARRVLAEIESAG